MLTEQEKGDLKRQWLTQIAYWGRLPLTIYPPKIGQVYAFEMQDRTVKIGVSQDAQRRINEVQNARCMDVLRVYATDFALYDFMTNLEVICHKAFEERRMRGEFFNITFEEAVAELDSHAEEIAVAHKKADQRLLDEIDYFFNEFVPKFKKKFFQQGVKTTPALVAPVEKVSRPLSPTACVYALLMSNGTVKIGHSGNVKKRVSCIESKHGLTVEKIYHTPFISREIARLIEKACHNIFSPSKVDGEFFSIKFESACAEVDTFVKFVEALPLVSNFERGKILVELAISLKDSQTKEYIAISATNLIVGQCSA